ncbi:MAG TPA: serine/threonine-protein kinase [Candidatus Polarisedimenticolia bacterium]|nr:serine/threonine-protein kinase [Candidatus Polarisedimenticolia bacterium]
MRDDPNALMVIAGRVADGEAIDWPAEAERHRHLGRSLRNLQVVAGIAAVHSEPQAGEDAPLTGIGVPETLPFATLATARPAALATPAAATPATPDMSEEAAAAAAAAPATPHMPPPPFDHWGPLRIIGRLGHGGAGEVYRAHDPSLQRDVALKLPRGVGDADDTAGRRFLEEARRLARVRHPNVLVVHGADRHDGRVGLWADLLDGETLETILARQGPFGAEEAALVGVDLCRALAAVHGAGLIHQDVKTTNVMRVRGGRIVLLDFGSVRERPGTGGSSGEAGASGTPLFMAPEIFLGERATPASDIYSLGVVLYRLVSMRYPVTGTDVADLSVAHRRPRTQSLRDVRADLPAAFVQVIERALAADPRRRYATPGEMERDLIAAIGSGRPPEPVPVPTSWWRLGSGLGVAAALAIAAMIMWPSLFGFARPLRVEASLFRSGTGTVERLLPGGHVAPGDRLFLEIEGSQAMHVYVLNEDAAGNSFVLFPLPDSDLQNPLVPRRSYRLPGGLNGAPSFWEVSSAGGEETIVAIASSKPLEEVRRFIGGLPVAKAGGPSAPAPDTVSSLRGIGAVTTEPPAKHPLNALFQDLNRRAAQDGTLWVWQVRLGNPGG